jgi:dipeptidyl aminopeptidase/acylaminoacyl peptidase
MPLSRIAAAVAGILVIGLLAWPAVQHLREQPPPLPDALLLAFPDPAGAELGSGDDVLDAAIAPDGREIVFVATSRGTSQLWRRRLGTGADTPIPYTEGAQSPAWSPDGRAVAFVAGGGLKVIELQASSVREVAKGAEPGGVAWMPDGSLLFATGERTGIKRQRDGAVSDATTLQDGDERHLFPGVDTRSPGAFLYVAVRRNGRRVVRLVEDGAARDLTETSGHAAMVDGTLVHVRDGALIAERLDPETGMLVKPSTSLATGIGIAPSGRAMFAASSRLVLAASPVARVAELAWFGEDGRKTGTSGDPGDYWQVRLSPDDRRAAVALVDPLLRTFDVHLIPTSGGGSPIRVTRSLSADSDPVWSPDGSRLLFRSLHEGQPNLFTIRANDPSEEIQPFSAAPIDGTPTDWTARGVLFHAARQAGSSDVWTIEANSGERLPAANSGFSETDGRWSPDGNWIAHVSDESGQPDVYVVRGVGGTRTRVSFAGGTHPRWSADGRALFFLRGNQVMRSDFAGGAFAAARPVIEVAGVRDFDVAHASRRLLLVVPTATSTRAAARALVEWRSLMPGRD